VVPSRNAGGECRAPVQAAKPRQISPRTRPIVLLIFAPPALAAQEIVRRVTA